MSSKVLDYNIQISLDIMSLEKEPNAIVEKIGVSPTSMSRRGERDAQKVIPKHNRVSYRSQANSWEASFEDHWKILKGLLFEKADKIKRICEENDARITIIVEHEGRFPSIFMEKDFIVFAAKIGVPIDIDVYE